MIYVDVSRAGDVQICLVLDVHHFHDEVVLVVQINERQNADEILFRVFPAVIYYFFPNQIASKLASRSIALSAYFIVEFV